MTAHQPRPTLSILIASHNHDCSRLIADLSAQCTRLKTSGGALCEIIVGDDASDNTQTLQANREACTACGVKFVEMAQNVGKANLDNLLADESAGEWLMFIDDDAEVCTDDFVAQCVKDRTLADVVCGLLITPGGGAPEGCELRYRYEHAATANRTMEARNRHPYDNFTTFNPIMSREAFDATGFDPRCTDYGFEDVLFGHEIEKQGLTIAHTNTPLVHTGIDSNASFLDKTERATATLLRLGHPLTDHVGASRVAQRLHRMG
ncbi:MAG: glycosyltransferase, partial [Alloprevotella sp.]|nr:glycosyltransferase [Prevotellamassilia sp.]MDY5761679.1 glycosyltransferase [Alloprevotella sp.]